MKNILLYNYGLSVDDYKDIHDGISFYVDYNKYYFLKVSRVKSDINIIDNMLSGNRMYHYIVKNKNSECVTTIDNINYVLLRINSPEHNEVDLYDMINNQKIISNDSLLRRDNWGELWSEKVDYLEYQVSELSKHHPIILSSFSYYVGLAENAIEYFNMLDIKDVRLVISQKRILYPNINLNYYNPLNIVVDYRVRDIAEYIKTMFFNKEDALEIVKNLVLKNYLTPLEYNLLYARLLYPSYYFDDVYMVLEKGKDEDELLKYVDESSRYEDFLRSVYGEFVKKCTMIKIDWLIKKSS